MSVLPDNIDAWPRKYRELYEERAAIIEFQGNMSRTDAEFRAECDIRKQKIAEQTKEQQRELCRK